MSSLPGSALIGAVVILVIGFFIMKLVHEAGGLTQAGLDRNLLSGRSGEWVSKVAASPSRLIGRIAFWAIFLAFVSIAASALGIEAVSAFVAAVWGYLPNVIAALAIFLVAGAISAGVATLATRLMGDTPTGRIVATAAPILVMTIATFMILEQLKIAHDIVVTTYTLLLGSIALGAAWRSASAAATSLRECSRVRTRRASERPVRSSKTSSARDEAERMSEDVSQQTQTSESSSPTSVPVR